jgi:hypothetical protein
VNGSRFLSVWLTGFVLSTSAFAEVPSDFNALAGSGALRWIWHKAPGEIQTSDAPQEKVWLRRTFELPADKVPTRAELILAVDNRAGVIVNGKPLGIFEGWSPLTRKEIGSFLRPGRNVIAVEANNPEASPAGFIGLIEIPGVLPILFDAQTKSAKATKEVKDWMDPDFNDSSWKTATLLMPADWGPWGKISAPVKNPTAQVISENFPTFIVPGFEKQMEQMRQILFGHYRMDLSILPAFNIQWIAPAAIWAGLDDRPSYSYTRASLLTRLLTMRTTKDGYVSCHQHEGLGYSEGWPFPLYTQSGGAGWIFSTTGLPYGAEFNVHPTKSMVGWTLDNAEVVHLDSANGLRLALKGPDATMTSASLNVVAPAATWIRLKFIPGKQPLRPYLQWTTAEHPEFSDERKVAFEVPTASAPNQPVDVDIPIHPVTHSEGTLTRLRLGFGNTETDQITILRLFTSVDTRHNWNNANFTIAAVTYFDWTGDMDFLRDFIGKLRQIFRYSMEEFSVRQNGVVVTPWAGKDGRPGLTKNEKGEKVLRYGLGVGCNYWDLLPFGGKDAYSTIYQFAAVRAMEELESAIAAHPEWKIPAPPKEYNAAHLREDMERIRKAYTKTFWIPKKGRFAGAVDSTGKVWDYGFTFLNNEAMYYGLTAPEQNRKIVDWISGAREIKGETSVGKDIYRFRFGPRSTTERNEDYYTYVWTAPEKIPFGGQVQDGGSVFGFTFHDLMGRLRTNGPDDAWKRLQEILMWFGEVQQAGGYRCYYSADKAAERGTLQGGGPPGGLGIDQEFYETLLVPLIMTEGFLGMSVSPNRIRFAPQLPKDWPSLEVGRIQYHDWLLKAKATHDSLTLELKADLKARPIQIELGPGPWQVKILDGQDQVLHEQTIVKKQQPTVTIDNPASRKLVVTRSPKF